MTNFTRADRSVVGLWWWTVDRWTLATVGALMFMGAILVLAASPAVATRIGLDSFSMVRHHYVMLPVAFAVVLGVSMLSPKQVRRLGVLLFLLFLGLTTLTLLYGTEIKGATRWIAVGPFSLQPSEFLKPTFAIFAAWMFSLKMSEQRVPGNLIAIATFALVVFVLLKQPDLGMTAVITATWFAQFFVAGLPFIWVILFAGLGAGGLVGAYFMFFHVHERVDQFLKGTGDSYQIDRALEAFQNGGLTGRGPGEGSVKMVLPDAHSDFIFAVAGEEFGLVVCLMILALFAFVTMRSMSRASKETSLFITLAGTGLGVQFGLQAAINMASTIQLIPAKGMTLPFISYGGSSALAMAICLGMLLSLTREHAGLREAV